MKVKDGSHILEDKFWPLGVFLCFYTKWDVYESNYTIIILY